MDSETTGHPPWPTRPKGSADTMQEPRPAEGCDSDRACYEMLPKPGGSYEVRLFTCVECGHGWRES